jgi:phospholipid/cholesterol/gamma-HCH transport system substrate-binding protein
MQRKIGLGTNSTVANRLRLIGGNQVALGSIVVLVAVIALTLTTFLYLDPPNRKTFTFETTDASALSVGQDVRVAGVSVGTVSAVTIKSTTVAVTSEIEEDMFLGTESKINVRMLTPVGGYAITLIPLGTTPLGSSPIPVPHVTVPYSIGDVLQAAPTTTDNVDGGTVDANIDEVADALQHNSTSVGSLISGMNSIAGVMDRQRDQVQEVMDLAAEYLQTYNANREFVFDLIRQIDIVLSTYNNSRVGFNESYRLLGNVLLSVQPLMEFYLNHKDEVRSAVEQTRRTIEDFERTMGPALDNLQGLQQQLERWLTPEGLVELKGGTIAASDLCIPIAGRTC